MGLTATSARRAAGAAVLLLAGAGTAGAQTVVAFDGAVVQSCVLSVTTPGVLGGNTNGTEIGSEQTGGTAAVLAITATAGAPTIAFAAPTMSLKPVTYTGTAAVTYRYTSPGGANQGYTSGASQYTSTNALGDTVTLHAKATDAAGFVAGSYRIQTTVTCQQ